MMRSFATASAGWVLLFACGGKVPIGANPAPAGAGGTASSMAGGALARGGSLSDETGGRATQAGGASGGAVNMPLAGTGGGSSAGASSMVPTEASGCAKQLASGQSHLCVLFEDGKVACAGENGSGELGAGVVSSPLPQPNYVRGLEGTSTIAAGGYHTCALAEGGFYCWGDNAGSELGHPSSEMANSALPILTELQGFGVVQLALGVRQSCVLDRLVHGTCWGIQPGKVELTQPTQLAQIGLSPRQILQMGWVTRLLDGERLYEVDWGGTTSALVPGATTGVIENAFGRSHECLLKRSGMVFCKGEGYPDFYSAVMDFGTHVAEVKAGAGFTCARTREGQVLCRGRNDVGQLGNGAPSMQANAIAAPVPGIEQAVELSLGARHACARLRDASVWCWGILPGAAQRSLPERITGPGEAQTCAAAASVPRPWGEAPTSRPADELGDAALAWAHNQCRCVFPEGGDDDAALVPCVNEETHVLNGCLQALAPNETQYATCRTPYFRNAASCALTCLGTGTLPSDCIQPIADCGTVPGVVEFCMRGSLLCDDRAMNSARAAQTCDGKADCPNGFDEANCQPNAAAFTCADGSKIPLELVHDGTSHCPDGSDFWP